MKKIISTLLFIFAVTGELHAQFSFGPEVGIDISTIKIKKNNNSGYYYSIPSQSSIVGFKGGGVIDCRLGPNSGFHFQSGVFFSSEGAGFGNGQQLVVNYLQIPANLVYKFSTGPDDYFFIGAGPFTGFVVGGSITSYGTTHHIKTGSDPNSDDVEPNDWGLGFQAGYQFGFGLFLRGQYLTSGTSVIPNENNDIAGFNHVFSITTGWLFGGKQERSRYPHYRNGY